MKDLVLIIFMFVFLLVRGQEYDFLYEDTGVYSDLNIYEIEETTYYDVNGLEEGSSETTVDAMGRTETIYKDEYGLPVGRSEREIRGRLPKRLTLRYDPYGYSRKDSLVIN